MFLKYADVYQDSDRITRPPVYNHVN